MISQLGNLEPGYSALQVSKRNEEKNYVQKNIKPDGFGEKL